MKFDVLLVGFGVIGVEALNELVKNYKGKKIINVALVDKNILNIPGGVAYSKSQSKFGFFNNPLRLSNPDFIKWIKKRKNIQKIKNFILNNKNFNLLKWLENNNHFNNYKTLKFSELYLPRLTYSFFLEDKIISSLKKIRKKNISIKFFEGEFTSFEKDKLNDGYFCSLKKKSANFNLYNSNATFKFVQSSSKLKHFFAKNLIFGNGLLPPKKIKETIYSTNRNYIWDFYAEGGTQNLIIKIKKQLLKKKIVKIIFIGNKAGLLEAMPEIAAFSEKLLKRIKIISFASNFLSVEKAELSKNYSNYKFKYFKKFNLKKIKKSKQIYFLLKKEFNYAQKNGFSKYDAWTLILKKKILNKIYFSLTKLEKKIYNDEVFSKIRNITRYTYPITIKSKNILEDKKILSYVADKVTQLNKMNNQLTVITAKQKRLKGDIVVNVSGPVRLDKATNEVDFLSSLKKNAYEFNYRGFLADKDFCIGKKIYAPGVLSSNFNPNRFTIIKAITLNTRKCMAAIIKTLK